MCVCVSGEGDSGAETASVGVFQGRWERVVSNTSTSMITAKSVVTREVR